MHTGKREVNSGYQLYVEKISKQGQNKLSRPKQIASHITHALKVVLCIPLYASFVILSTAVISYAYIYIVCSGRKASSSAQAIKYIKRFAPIYPFHLYPLVAKSLEMYYLCDIIRVQHAPLVFEVAIGDGYLSKSIFGATEVFGFDINPYSLDKADGKHIRQKVVANCLRLPVMPHSGATLVANNLMHHITDKSTAISDWAGKVGRLVFNENTIYWATSWPLAALAKSIGLTKTADEIVQQINNTNMQTLLSKPELDTLVSRLTGPCKTYSYYSQKVHTISLLYSCLFTAFIQPCYGPPTPAVFKRVIEYFPPVEKLTHYLTELVAAALIRLDAIEERDKDVFVHYDCKGLCTQIQDVKEAVLSCPDCMSPLHGQDCPKCSRHFQVINGMLFLCDEAVASNYTPEASASIPKHHL